MKNETRMPKRGPGARMNPGEKAKDFKSAITRLFRELKGQKILICVSLVLAIFSAVLSILAPDRLSKLTDEVTKGLGVDTENINIITEHIEECLTEENIQLKLNDILGVNIGALYEQSGNTNSLISIPTNMFEDSTYNGTYISAKDKLNFVQTLVSGENIKEVLADNLNILKALLTPLEIDGVLIGAEEQIQFITLMKSYNPDEKNATQMYALFDSLSTNLQTVLKGNLNIDVIKKISYVLLGMYICSALFNFIQSISMTDVANKFAKKLRSRISNKINKLPLKYFDKNQAGDTLSRITNDVDTIAQSMNHSLASLISSITLFVGTLIMMFATNYIMAFTAIIASLIGFSGMSLILKNSQKYFLRRQIELGKLNAHIEEIYSGLNVVKVYNGKKEANIKFDEYNKKVCENNRKSQFLSGIMQPLMGFVGNFGYVAVCIVGALLVINGNITFGVIVAFMTYVRMFTSPLSQIAQAMTSLQSTAAASERVFEFLDEEEMEKEDSIKTDLPKEKIKGKIEFKDVVFKYDGNDDSTIKNFTATALPGQKIAIVGPTGAGKTTMVNLLMKFYNISGGEILIDGVSTKDITRENIHSMFTMVLQDTWLFNGTIRENIIYNRENVTDEKISMVCREVGLDHFIKTLPNGLDTVLNENDGLSAGQKQLLTIARGMIEDAPFLILDEATSNVDTRTEELVQNAMDKLSEGKTSFIIAHRLSTIKNADLILVMKDGNIIEQGNHNELITKKGFYADLYNSQFELN